jgi:hypothetical protein
MGHEAKKVAQFGDIQLAVVVAVRRLKLCFEKAQQLRFADGAFSAAAVFDLLAHRENLVDGYKSPGSWRDIFLRTVSKSCQN